MIVGEPGSKASYYVTNFPDNIPLFRLRQGFEVCGILSDIYVARHRNARGQEFGFVRFVNVKNKHKLARALNNVWFNHCCVWAREARFDRFAHNDVVANPSIAAVRVKVSLPSKNDDFEDGNKKPISTTKEVLSVEDEGMAVKLNVSADVKVPAGGNTHDSGLSLNPGITQKPIQPEQYQLVNSSVHLTPKYQSRLDDRSWASSGMVATVIGNESSLALKQRVDDAGFNNVDVIPMGGDRVFLQCSDGRDIWQVFNEAVDFFGMLFTNIHRWSDSDAKYERGAWVRVFGVPIHAWNEDFFRLCVSKAGRFIRVDNCTADKSRLDYARILISTHNLDIIDTLSDFFIDDCNFKIKVVEEWGFCLGEDIFMSEEESNSSPETLTNPVNAAVLEEVQGEWELDALVDDLQREWVNHEGKTKEEQLAAALQIEENENQEQRTVCMEHHLTPKSQNVVQNNYVEAAVPLVHNITQQLCDSQSHHDGSASRNSNWIASKPSCTAVQLNQNSTATALPTKGTSAAPLSSKIKPAGHVNRSLGFFKRVARLPTNDRKEILKILKKHDRAHKVRKGKKCSGSAATTTSGSSKNSISSVDQDWENWVILHGNSNMVKEDIKVIGKKVGIKYQCDTSNSFNLLTREGRKGRRPPSGGEDMHEGGEGDEGDIVGV